MKWIAGLILFWLTFVVSLTAWWLYFGLTILSEVVAFSQKPQFIRHQRMLFMEGCVLIAFLLCGGVALFYFSYRMYKEKSAKEMFFASFTHDLKTSLFRMQLEIEKWGKAHCAEDAEKVLIHTRKMHLDLENSLDSIVGGNKKIFIEQVNFKDFMKEIHAQWSELGIKYSGDEFFYIDRKALHSIFKNLLHNSVVHGRADEVSVHLSNSNGQSQLFYKDNGESFQGNINNLGQIYHYKTGGSGFGLFIVQQWVSRLGGDLVFTKNKMSQSLEISMQLPRGSR